MMQWLKNLKRRWRRARGREIFERLRSAADALERHRIRTELARRVLPPDGPGWSRYYLAVISALALRIGPGGEVADPEGRFNRFFVEFALAYPGMVPANLPPAELGAFACAIASRKRSSQRRA
jgi:hypothetical protein